MNSEKVIMETKSFEDNMELMEKARSGNKEALDKLVEVNLPLVSAISKKFLNRGYEYDDIFQIGCIGLVKAINNFETKYKCKILNLCSSYDNGRNKEILKG